MKSEKSSISSLQPLPQQKQDTLSVSEMLTPYEIEQLRQDKKETSAYARKAFAHLRPTA